MQLVSDAGEAFARQKLFELKNFFNYHGGKSSCFLADLTVEV